MRILVEILHPAHVHFFKNPIAEWRRRGDEVLVLSREKECASDLLDAYEIPYKAISRLGKQKFSLYPEMLRRIWRMWKYCRSFKPDVLTGIMGVTIAPVSRLVRRPAVVFYDTENATLTNRFVYPLAHSVCTPECYKGQVKGNHITYPGYHELAYLHPERFKPDPDIVRRHGIDPGGKYFIVRFVSWQASHDIGEKGLGPEFGTLIVEKLAPHGQVLVTSESRLPEHLEPYRCQFPPEDIHHIMAFAHLLVGESATMASESAVLGVPALFISNTGRGYTDEQQEKYGLVFNFTTSHKQEILSCLDQLLHKENLKEEFDTKKDKLLSSRIDTTNWIIQHIDKVAGKPAQHSKQFKASP